MYYVLFTIYYVSSIIYSALFINDVCFAIYYGIFSANHPELAYSFFPIIQNYLPLGREQAKEYNCSGTHFPGNKVFYLLIFWVYRAPRQHKNIYHIMFICTYFLNFQKR